MPKRILALPVLAATALALVAGASARTNSGSIALVAYSTPRAAYADLIPAFLKTAAGKDTSFSQSYGASGEQARAVEAGLKADVVALSLEPDVTSLVNKGLVARGWKNNKWGGIVTRSVVVFAVRRGNPKKIRDWEDLVKPGVQVVTPNVQTSGGAKWNIMAAYGAQLRKKKTHAQAVAYLRNLYRHIVSQDKSAREALQTFLAGRGDVMLAYENEAIFANQNNQEVPYVIPKATIRIENPAAVTTKSENKATANAFLRFLRTVPHSGSTRRTATGPSCRRRRRASRSRSDRSSSRSSGSAAGRRSTSASSTRTPGSSRGSSARPGAELS